MPKPFHLEAREVLRLNQQETADLLGLSKRTIQRWDAGRGGPWGDSYKTFAKALFPRDPALAARAAAAAGTTLEALGIAPKPAPKQGPSMDYLLDTLVSVAAVAAESKPAVIRPAVAAAFTFARQFGLSLEAVEGALAAKVAKPKT